MNRAALPRLAGLLILSLFGVGVFRLEPLPHGLVIIHRAGPGERAAQLEGARAESGQRLIQHFMRRGVFLAAHQTERAVG